MPFITIEGETRIVHILWNLICRRHLITLEVYCRLTIFDPGKIKAIFGKNTVEGKYKWRKAMKVDAYKGINDE